MARQAQSIAPTTQRFDGLERLVRIELAAQTSHEHLHNVAVAVEVLLVQTIGELGLRDHLPSAQHQMLENAVFETRQLHRLAADRDDLRACVELDGPAGEPWRRPSSSAAQQRRQPRLNLAKVERLGDIVIRAGTEALDLVLPSIARRENQHSVVLTARTELADQI